MFVGLLGGEDGFGGRGDFVRVFLFLFGMGCWDLFWFSMGIGSRFWCLSVCGNVRRLGV